ncbi:hypothetical protein F5884DRAFT_205181 [Xylogone sp. PMI_703]|nr:hypothetical protein F5884DRAFT_205181 [Xylogone sp. PMI_703]
MADVRSLLRSERAARRIQHPYATYSTTGTLICRVCNTQLKSESLWDAHLRGTQHAMKLQKMKDAGMAPAVDSESSTLNKKKRKANSDSPIGDDRKKIKAGAGLAGFIPEGFFDDGMEPGNGETEAAQEEEQEQEESAEDKSRDPKRPESGPVLSGKETTIPSRPATPLKPTPTASPHVPSTTKNPHSQQSTPLQKKSNAPSPPSAQPEAEIDESEWAAFEADIAAAEEQEQGQTQPSLSADAVISAPALSAAEVAAKSAEEEAARRREAREAELEGEKEDAVRKLEEEFEEMEGLEERVRRLREKREALRIREEGVLKGNNADNMGSAANEKDGVGDEDEDMDDDDDDEGEDDWDGFRLR